MSTLVSKDFYFLNCINDLLCVDHFNSSVLGLVLEGVKSWYQKWECDVLEVH